MNKNNTHTVIQRSEVTKNLGSTHLMYPRSFATLWMTIIMVLFISSCQHEEMPPVAKDALALLPAETPVSIQAQLQGGFAQGGSRTGTTTNWYASDEIHPTKQNMRFTLLMPGGSSETVLTNQLSSFDQLPQTEPFSTLMLKDFNLTEGNNRCVSRWTSLYVTSNGSDWLFGFARLKANASGQPVLDYGKLGRAYAKVTLVLQDELQQPIAVNQHGILAKLTQAKSSVGAMYTPEGETQGMAFSNIKNGIQTLVSDEEIAKENLGWAVLKNDGMWEHSLSGMCNADGTEYYFGANDNELTAIVFPTPTHVSEDRIYTPIQGGPQLTDDEKLTIEVKEDPDGANGPLTTGKYTLKLKDVKLADGTNLTALKSGEHLTLTVTLQHNMLVEATATIGGWDEVRADVDLNQDPSKLPPYEYDAETKTYTVNEESYVKTVWGMKAADDKVMYDGMLVVDGSASTDDLTSVINGAIAAGIKNYYVINEIGEEGFSLKNAIQPLVNRMEGDSPLNPDDPNIGTLSIVLADATLIPDWSFNACHALKSLSAPIATIVDEKAFQRCSGLEKVTLDAATTIRRNAFYNCISLKELTFGSVITEIEERAFMSDAEEWTPNCALTLASGQQHMTEAGITEPGRPEANNPVTPADEDAEENRRIWADYTWKSITIK